MSNRLPFAALAAACITAAAAGGYIASKQNAVPTPASAQTAPVATAQTSPAASTPAPVGAPVTAERPVQETEAVVGDRDAKVSARRNVEAAPSSPSPRERAKAPATSARREQAPPTLTSSWPSSAAQQPPAPTAPPAPSTAPDPAAPRIEDRAVQEPPRPIEPPRPTFEELVVSRDSVIGLETNHRITSETANIEDRVDARLTRDVKVGDRIAIPAGARVIGTVTQVERGGKFKEQARLGIRFHTIVLADGTRLPISTEPIVRVGESPTNSSAAKIGGSAVGGAILGAILGGAKGAAIGATAGAGAGTAVVQAGDPKTVVIQPGTPLTARILSPVTINVERD